MSLGASAAMSIISRLASFTGSPSTLANHYAPLRRSSTITGTRRTESTTTCGVDLVSIHDRVGNETTQTYGWTGGLDPLGLQDRQRQRRGHCLDGATYSKAKKKKFRRTSSRRRPRASLSSCCRAFTTTTSHGAEQRQLRLSHSLQTEQHRSEASQTARRPAI